jgi:hypothetical protein
MISEIKFINQNFVINSVFHQSNSKILLKRKLSKISQIFSSIFQRILEENQINLFENNQEFFNQKTK